MSYEVGRGKPPKDTRFKKGVSGNLRGKPRAPLLPYERILGREMEVRVNGVIEMMPAEKAFVRHITKQAREKGGALARLIHNKLKEVEEAHPTLAPVHVTFHRRQEPGEVSDVLISLGMAICLSPLQPGRKVVIENWLVDWALSQLGDRRLSVDEQRVVYEATRRPHRVKWPEWWSVRSADASVKDRSQP